MVVEIGDGDGSVMLFGSNSLVNCKACLCKCPGFDPQEYQPVTHAVSYLPTGLAGCSVGPGISCGVQHAQSPMGRVSGAPGIEAHLEPSRQRLLPRIGSGQAQLAKELVLANNTMAASKD
ncbi:hypothetical protein NC651_015125 [Populus alba x Populus x berolinensis]|nr:hypothetical protein NC651_015125 [Populus alba x Populus x berolinensis]